jgi:hypothetical protein
MAVISFLCSKNNSNSCHSAACDSSNWCCLICRGPAMWFAMPIRRAAARPAVEGADQRRGSSASSSSRSRVRVGGALGELEHRALLLDGKGKRAGDTGGASGNTRAAGFSAT